MSVPVVLEFLSRSFICFTAASMAGAITRTEGLPISTVLILAAVFSIIFNTVWSLIEYLNNH